MFKMLFQHAVSIQQHFVALREIKVYYQHVSFLDAESLDSGMSLTNATDVRHTDPELKVFYRVS